MDWDDAYANGAHIANADSYPPRWRSAAAALRKGLGERARLDMAYGAGPRERFDLFLPAERPAGLVVFVHGGYWKAFGKDDWSHLAAGPLTRGWAVAVPGYALCPEVRIRDITRQIGAAIEAAAALVPGPIRLTGHSAGGHLVARMVCADTPLPPLVRTRIAMVVPISGVFDLRPLMQTKMNADLRLDAAEAAAESPALAVPETRAPVACWVGADERPEFVRQNALLANIWTGFGLHTMRFEETGRHHFDVIDGLTEPDSDLTGTLLASF